MIDTLLNLLFRCSHQRLTRPVTPVSRAGQPHGDTYVVCLDCGKQFNYDLKKMRIGKPIANSPDAGVLHAPPRKSRRKKLKYALWASIPVAVAIGAIWKPSRPKAASPKDNPPGPPKGGPVG